MVNRVVSTKLTEEEYSKLLEECGKHGLTPSALVKDAIMNKIQTTHDEKITSSENQDQRVKELSKEKLEEILGLKKTSVNMDVKQKPTLEETIEHVKNCRNPDCKYGRRNLGMT